VSEKGALSSSVPTREMIPAVSPLVKTGTALKYNQNITANLLPRSRKESSYFLPTTTALSVLHLSDTIHAPHPANAPADRESFRSNGVWSWPLQNGQSIKGGTKGTDAQLSPCLSAESWQRRVKIANLNSITRTYINTFHFTSTKTRCMLC